MKVLRKARARLAIPLAMVCAVSLTGLAMLSGAMSAAATAGSASSIKVVDVSGITLSGVSCNTSSFCVAVGSESDEATVLPISHGTPGAAEIVSAAGSFSTFNAVSCPDTTNCLAVGEGPSTSPQGPTTAGIVVGVTSGTPGSVIDVLGPGTLGSPDEDYLYGVGCTSVTVCMAGGDDIYKAGIVVTVTSSGHGNLEQISDGIMYGVSCLEKNYCIATGYATNSEQYGLADGEKIHQTTPVVWGGTGVASFDDVACHLDNSDSCLLVGSTTKQKGAVVPIIKLQSKQTAIVSGVTGLNGIACGGGTYCVAVGQKSGEGVLVGITGSKPGTAVPVPETTQLVAVGCASNLSCIAVGSDSEGAVLVEFSLPVR
jgi:hypothetical protein